MRDLAKETSLFNKWYLRCRAEQTIPPIRG